MNFASGSRNTAVQDIKTGHFFLSFQSLLEQHEASPRTVYLMMVAEKTTTLFPPFFHRQL